MNHRQLDVSEKGGSKKHQLPALKSGNAGSCILHRISGFDQRNFSGFLRNVFPVKQWPKHFEGLLMQPQNRCG
jgi:hypothetical protein